MRRLVAEDAIDGERQYRVTSYDGSTGNIVADVKLDGAQVAIR